MHRLIKKLFCAFILCINFFVISIYSTPTAKDSNLRFFSGTSNPDLAKEVANILGVNLNSADVGRYHDGEVKVRINDNIRGKDVYILQSICSTKDGSVNDHLMELYLLIRACKRSSAKRITAIIPYFGYARQDKKTDDIVPISASDIAMLLETAGADHIICLDLHSRQIQGFFHKISVDNLMTHFLFIPYIERKNLKNLVVVATEAGALTRARNFISSLNRFNIDARLTVFAKIRLKEGAIKDMHLIGNVKNSDVLIVDDMCDTGETLIEATKKLKKKGANRVYACITHPVFSNDTIDKIKDSNIDELVVTDTIPLKQEIPNNIVQISIAPFVAEAIRRSQADESLGSILDY
ncbi:MAG: Ribose-phosphate pyrophosphokinase [Candidatus Anoxychlamydiales bacterium]|nr:Ribose-phosphate pyrophosphokinase [Candidatus Anoxychlamydiales bacterium]